MCNRDVYTVGKGFHAEVFHTVIPFKESRYVSPETFVFRGKLRSAR